MSSITHLSPPQSEMSQDTPLLTVAGYRKLQSEYEADLKLQKELPKRIAAKKERLDAAKFFLPDGFDHAADSKNLNGTIPQQKSALVVRHIAHTNPDILKTGYFSSIEKPDEKITWTAGILTCLEEAGKGLTYAELRERIEKSPLAGKLAHSDKGFYGGIAKLLEKHELTKVGGRLYSKSVADRIVKHGGSLPTDLVVRHRTSASSDAVLKVLSEHPNGIIGPELTRLVRAYPGVPESMSKHKHYIYSVIKALHGLVVQKEGKYFLATKGEAPL